MEAHQILKNRQKKTKESRFSSKLIHEKCDESATSVTCFVGATEVCVGKKKQLKHFKQGCSPSHTETGNYRSNEGSLNQDYTH